MHWVMQWLENVEWNSSKTSEGRVLNHLSILIFHSMYSVGFIATETLWKPLKDDVTWFQSFELSLDGYYFYTFSRMFGICLVYFYQFSTPSLCPYRKVKGKF